MSNYSISELSLFLQYLNPNDKYFSFAFLTLEGALPGYGTFYGTLDDAIKVLQNTNNVTLHVTLNETDDKGRKTPNIKAVRVLCVDLDREVEKEEIKTYIEKWRVGMVVESSPKRYHLFWKISPEISLSTWKAYQLGLAYHFNGDLNLSQITKTIRVPGVERVTKKGILYTPEIKYLSEGELKEEDLISLFPDIYAWEKEGIKQVKEERQELKKRLKSTATPAVNSESNATPQGFTSRALGRNTTLYLELKDLVSSVVYNEGTIIPEPSFEALLSYGEELNEQFSPPLMAHEVLSCARSAYDRGMKAREKRIKKLTNNMSLLDEGNHLNGNAPMNDGLENSVSNNVVITRKNSESQEARKSIRRIEDDTFYKISKFSDRALLSRALHKHGKHLVRVGDVIYAFDTVFKVWRRQKPENSELIQGYIEEVCREAIADPDFIPTLCLDSRGQPSMRLKIREEARFLSNYTISSTARQLSRSEEIVRMNITSFDANPYELNVSNGVLNLLTGELREPEAKDYLLKKSSVVWKGLNEPCPYWEKFVLEVYESPTMVDFIQELFGYSLTGSISEQKIYIHVGEGSNGKSKTLEVLENLMGDYSSRVECSTISKKKTAVDKELNRLGAKLEGKRLAVIDDLDTATQWNEGFVKTLTSKSMPSRRLYAEEQDIPNRAKFHVGCNTIPAPETENYGILRRLCIIPYNRRFIPDAQKEREISAETEKEMSGILAWAVRGFQRYIVAGSGINRPEIIEEAVTEYSEEYFKLGPIIENHLVPDKTKNEKNLWSLDKIEQLIKKILVILAPNYEKNALSGIHLGRILRGKGFPCKRVQTGGKRFTGYYLTVINVENYTEKDPKDLI